MQMRIVFFLACWRRPEITELCFMGLKRLMSYKKHLFDCSAFAVISEEGMIPLCRKYGIDYLMHENLPLGSKKNAGISKILEKDFDYLIELGSDDLILDGLLDAYLPSMDEGIDFLGSKRLLIVDSTDGNARHFFFDPDLVQGLGRCFSRKMLMTFNGKVLVKAFTGIITEDALISEGDTGFLDRGTANDMIRMGWAEELETPYHVYLWDKVNRGLDNNSTNRILKKGFKFNLVETPEPLMADIKSDENIWAYNPEIGESYDFNIFLAKLSQKEKSMFFSLQKTLKAKRIEKAA